MTTNKAYTQNSPVEVKLGIFGRTGNDGSLLEVIPLEDSLLSFSYSLVAPTDNDEEQFTFKIELVNVDEFVENTIQDVYSRMYRSVHSPLGNEDDLKVMPQMFVQWGYGPKEEDGRSTVHVANITDVNYRFTSLKEKIITLVGKDTAQGVESLLSAAHIKKSVSLFRAEEVSSGGWVNNLKNVTSDIIFPLMGDILNSCPGVRVGIQPTQKDVVFVQELIKKASLLDQREMRTVMDRLKYETGSEADRAAMQALLKKQEGLQAIYSSESWEKYKEGSMQVNFLSKLGFTLTPIVPQGYYLWSYSLKGSGAAGIVTGAIGADMLGYNTKRMAAAASETTDKLYSHLLEKPLNAMEKEEGLPVTELEVGIDAVDIDGGLGGYQQGDKLDVISRSSWLINQYNQTRLAAFFSTVAPNVGLGWNLTEAGKAKLVPIIERLIHSSTRMLNDTGTEELRELLVDMKVVDEDVQIDKASMAFFDEDNLSLMSDEQRQLAWGSSVLPIEGHVVVSLISPLGESPYRTVKKVLNAFNRFTENRSNPYEVYKVPPTHMRDRNISMETYAQLMAENPFEIPAVVYYVGTFEDALDSELLSPNLDQTVGIRIYSFEELNAVGSESNFVTGGTSEQEGSKHYDWAYLSYGSPDSIVKFLDFNSEFWYLQNYYLGVAAQSKVKSSVHALTSENFGRAIFNFGQAVANAAEEAEGLTLEEQQANRSFFQSFISPRFDQPRIWDRFVAINRMTDGGNLNTVGFSLAPTVPLEWSLEEIKTLKYIVEWVTYSDEHLEKLGEFLAPRDVEVFKELKNFLNREEGRYKIPAFFAANNTNFYRKNEHLVALLLEDANINAANPNTIEPEEFFGKLRRGKESPDEKPAEPLSWTLQLSDYDAFKDVSLASQAKQELLAARMLHQTYASQIRVKTLGIPEMDSVFEITKRSVFLSVNDIGRKRLKDSGLRTNQVEDSYDYKHWLSGQYRPIGITHKISPTEGYTTELKMYRDPKSVRRLIAGLSENSKATMPAT